MNNKSEMKQMVSPKNNFSYFVKYGWTLIILVIGSCADSEQGRAPKLLNVFNIVKFPNEGCNSSISNVYGVCYTSSECSTYGGTSSGSCASGFGVCCTFTGGCSGSTTLNNTYFKSSDSDSSPCLFSVCKSNDDICQIRLNFNTFDIAQPSTNNPSQTQPNGRTQCQQAQFLATTSDGNNSPTICGTNTDYHMIVDADDDCNTLSFTWSSSTTRSWNIQIMQISCDAKWKPPEGCLQHFTGTTGYIYSYNYAGGTHLATQDYSNCIRTEQGYCSIEYTPVGGNFKISGPAPTATANRGDTCATDYIIISGGGSTAGATTNFDRFCGSLFSVTDGSTTGSTIFANKQPFQVGVFMDGNEVNPSTSVAESSVGFYIYYKQTACT